MAGWCEFSLQINFPFSRWRVSAHQPIPLWLCFCSNLYFTHHMRGEISLTASKDIASTSNNTQYVHFSTHKNARSIFSYTSYLRINYLVSNFFIASFDLLPLDSGELGEEILA